MPSKRPVNDDPAPEGFLQGIGEFDLPKAVVQRVVKQGLSDPSIKVHPDVILALVKSATVYINYVASAPTTNNTPPPITRSYENATTANRKTITASDVVRATTDHLRGVGGDVHAADELGRALDDELAAYREIQTSIKAAKATGGGAPASAGSGKRGFSGKGGKKDVSVGGEGEEQEQVEADIAVDADGEGEGDEPVEEQEEYDEDEDEEDVAEGDTEMQ
ncbi:hypothetical protein QFC19_008989 [Naganishia cerealis]|uniref:Uncharacterized protein n=1 Tax=Naganishia cerealis TaxID=610337 RepID=A0ACC2UXX2_9TREE|nr:hypothetical protein QFC19_008989 [Naganishia cerealis]